MQSSTKPPTFSSSETELENWSMNIMMSHWNPAYNNLIYFFRINVTIPRKQILYFTPEV